LREAVKHVATLRETMKACSYIEREMMYACSYIKRERMKACCYIERGIESM
jgi:hypothetical protein